jgi:hypothetical protein
MMKRLFVVLAFVLSGYHSDNPDLLPLIRLPPKPPATTPTCEHPTPDGKCPPPPCDH